MPAGVEAKKVVVSEIGEKLQKAKSVVLVDYKGLTVDEDTELRKQFREAGVEYKVLKNTLVLRAAKENGIEGLDGYLNGPSAFAFGYDDPVAPAKILSDYIKKVRKMEIKGGVLGTSVIDAKGVDNLASMPSKEVIIAKMLGSMNAPIANFVGVLSATLRSVVTALDAIRKQKEEA